MVYPAGLAGDRSEAPNTRLLPPVLVTVTVCGALVVPTGWLPNARLLALRLATGGAGFRVITAEPVLEESAPLVATTVTVVVAVIEAGAVYRPSGVTLPTPEGTLQLTVWKLQVLWATVAANCCVWDGPRLTAGGLTVTVMAAPSVRVSRWVSGPVYSEPVAGVNVPAMV